MPASTTIISSPKRSSVQFIPNSPMPPRGMISKTLDTYDSLLNSLDGLAEYSTRVILIDLAGAITRKTCHYQLPGALTQTLSAQDRFSVCSSLRRNDKNAISNYSDGLVRTRVFRSIPRIQLTLEEPAHR